MCAVVQLSIYRIICIHIYKFTIIHVSVYAIICVLVYSIIHVYVDASIESYIYTCMHVCTFTCLHDYMYTCIHFCKYTSIHVYAAEECSSCRRRRSVPWLLLEKPDKGLAKKHALVAATGSGSPYESRFARPSGPEANARQASQRTTRCWSPYMANHSCAKVAAATTVLSLEPNLRTRSRANPTPKWA